MHQYKWQKTHHGFPPMGTLAMITDAFLGIRSSLLPYSETQMLHHFNIVLVYVNTEQSIPVNKLNYWQSNDIMLMYGDIPHIN